MTTTAPPTATGPVTVAFDGVSFQYPGVAEPSLRNVDLQIHEGELILVIGPTGSGKTTFLRSINGLVPHFSGGLLRGRVSVVGRDTEHNAPRELADLIGFVPQDPADSFVCDTVEEELAYAMENLGIAPVVMRRRVEETLDLLSITDLRGRNTATLSGGQQQRRHRRGAHHLTPDPRARRADLIAGPRSRRGGARRHHPARARCRAHCHHGRAPPRAGRTPRRSDHRDRWSDPDDRVPGHRDAHRSGGAAGGRARTCIGMEPVAAVGPRRGVTPSISEPGWRPDQLQPRPH